MSRLRIIAGVVLGVGLISAPVAVAPAAAQPRAFGGGFGYRPPAPVFRPPAPLVRPFHGYRPYHYGYRSYYRPYYPGWAWAPFGLGLGLGLAWGWPGWWYPPAVAYPAYPAYPYASPSPPAFYGPPGAPVPAAPYSPWQGSAATASICRVGPVTCDLPVPLEPGTACSCPGGRRGEIWGRAQ
ncbi:MAG TPA: hypothetical protein VD970_02650 [Acetobacteraceae bacterium]|nr:hypothetical protein [Acetobacteraceae bacterium]